MTEKLNYWDYLIIGLFLFSILATAILIDNSTSKFCFCLSNNHCVTSQVSVESQEVYNIKGSFQDLRNKYDVKTGEKINRTCQSFSRFDPEQTQVLFEKDFIQEPQKFEGELTCFCLDERNCALAIVVESFVVKEFFNFLGRGVVDGSIQTKQCNDFPEFIPGKTEIIMEGFNE